MSPETARHDRPAPAEHDAGDALLRRPGMNTSRFLGRTKELAWLRNLWDEATTRDASGRFVGGPRMGIVLAESGYGKSRLVQALYQQLTIDPVWDPEQVNYWPDAFQEPTEQLRVNPDPGDHAPKGPPQFMWLGMRWQPTEERNVEERTCAIPAARDALLAHVRIADRHRPAWEHARAEIERTIRRGSVASTIARAADLLIPFGELGVRLAQGAVDLARDRRTAGRNLDSQQRHQSSDASEEFLVEMREVFGGTGSAGRVLPTILWLDDAQWIDSATLECIEALWKEAQQRSWPLLVLATHWEREWEELRSSQARSSLAAFGGRAGVSELRLGESSRVDLAAYLEERLPGLSAPQRELLLDKSGGVFLTMVENVGELLANPDAFVDGQLTGPLTTDGERFVREWESQRQRRVEQRFAKLASEVRTVLGWGSALGVRFLKDVIADHATRTGVAKQPELILDACVVPYAILGSPSANLREFRDRAFHAVARKHFDRWGRGHEDSLRATLRDHLVRWVNASFDEEGSVLRPNEAKETAMLERGAAIFLEPGERRDLLGMAVAELRLPEVPDWAQPQHAAALRARLLLTWTDAPERLYGRVRHAAATMAGIDWDAVPTEVIDTFDRFVCARDWAEAGAQAAAKPLLLHVLREVRRSEAEDDGEHRDALLSAVLSATIDIEGSIGSKATALELARESVSVERRRVQRGGSNDAREALAIALLDQSDLELALDDPTASRACCDESLRIRESMLGESPTPLEQRSVSLALDHLGYLAELEGDLRAAEANYARSLTIARGVAASRESPQVMRDLSISLMNMAGVLSEKGQHADALGLIEEAVGLCRELASEDDRPERREDLSHALELAGDEEAELERLDAAWGHYGESLALRRATDAEAPTLAGRRGISTTLSSMTTVAERQGRHRAALELAREALALDREAARALRTSKTLRDLGVALTIVARLEDIVGEEAALDHAEEALGVRKRALAALDRALHRTDLWHSFAQVARMLADRMHPKLVKVVADWLDFHEGLGEEGEEMAVGGLAAGTACSAMILMDSDGPVSAIRRAEQALDLIGEDCEAADDPESTAFGACLIGNAVIATCLHELGEPWSECRRYLRRALDLATILDRHIRNLPDAQPQWWETMGCCLAFKAAERYLRSVGDTQSQAKAMAKATQWESRLDRFGK
jgi:tetratricopeptide (TPR) repeat protein